MEKIFISIASCKEHFLEQTIHSALGNAKYPDRIYFGIFNTVINEKPFNCLLKNVYIKNLQCTQPPGLGFSRKEATKLCPPDADYILQIDAHMIFEKNWDESLIISINEIEKKYNKIIISLICPNWTIDENQNIIIHPFGIVDSKNVPKREAFFPPTIAYNSAFESIGHSYPQTWGHFYKWQNESHIEVKSIAGCFVFARKKMFEEIEHDARCKWGADEGLFAMRAWTRGYKIFTINKSIAYHLNKDENYQKAKEDWRDHIIYPETAFFETFITIKNIFLGKEIGKYGALNIESLKEYEEFCNFDFNKFYDILDLRS